MAAGGTAVRHAVACTRAIIPKGGILEGRGMAGTTAIVTCLLGLFGVSVAGIVAVARVKLAQIEQKAIGSRARSAR